MAYLEQSCNSFPENKYAHNEEISTHDCYTKSTHFSLHIWYNDIVQNYISEMQRPFLPFRYWVPWELICSTSNSFPCLFRLSWTWLFMSNLAGVSRKEEDAYLTSAPGPCAQFLILMESKMLIYFCYFVCIIFVIIEMQVQWFK